MIGFEFVCPVALLIWASIVGVLAIVDRIKKKRIKKRLEKERVDDMLRDLEKLVTNYLEDEKKKNS